MKKSLNASTLSILLLSIAFVVMSVGFAAYAQTLNITGNVTAKKAEWNVQFDSTSYAESTGSVKATTKTLNTTAMNYTVTLNPGEFYEFTVNVKNAGTIAATLKSITLSSLTAEQQKYIKYTVTYDGTAYTSTTSGLSNDLAADASKTVKVRVEYVFPDDSSDLPNEDVTLNLTASLDYAQKS
jgi:uncharacterized repeat protein (TIGR01451 family)